MCELIRANSYSAMHESASFHLLGSHQGQEVPSHQSHQETPEHTNKQHGHVTRAAERAALLSLHCKKTPIWMQNAPRRHKVFQFKSLHLTQSDSQNRSLQRKAK